MKINKYIFFLFYLIVNFSFSQDIFEGYTLFTPQVLLNGGATTYLIDNNYNTIQSWEHQNGPASMPYLIAGDSVGIENSYLIYPFRVENPTMQSGGVGGGVQCLSWDGQLIWEFILSNDNYQHHHDIEPLPNGNILVIAWERKTATEAYNAGRSSLDGNPLNEMWSTAILEIEPAENGSVEVVWEWHLWDHLIQDINPDTENYGIISENPQLFNINNGVIGGGAGMPGAANADWMHVNAISYHKDWDQIVISSRYQNEIFVIDHSTTIEQAASHSGGNYGKGGDFLYRWGNPQNYNRGTIDDRILNAQHSVNWVPNNYPGSNNFIFFNNYQTGGGPMGESAVLEFIPPVDLNGNYTLDENSSYGPSNYIWSFQENIFTPIQGGSFRLPNGNTLITDCDDARILEVTNSGNIVWEYTNNESSNVVIARSQKYAIDYFDGIDNEIIGDINVDGIINILDIISLINLILDGYYVNYADLNQDGFINILDVVSLSNIILNSMD